MSVAVQHQPPPPARLMNDIPDRSPTISEVSALYSDEKAFYIPETPHSSDVKDVSSLDEAPKYSETDPPEYSDLPEVIEGPVSVSKLQTNFHKPTARILEIKARGKELFRLPTAPRETVTLVTDPDGRIAYTSSRSSCNSGKSVLADSNGTELVGTDYFNKWGKDPVLHHTTRRCLNNYGVTHETTTDIDVKTAWPSSNIKFTDSRSEKSFEWRYRKSVKDSNGGRVKVMALIMRDIDNQGNPTENLLATLVRGEDTRTPGSGRFTAGNGGQLTILDHATPHLEEELIVSSCILMLKREVERRRAHQALTLVAVVVL